MSFLDGIINFLVGPEYNEAPKEAIVEPAPRERMAAILEARTSFDIPKPETAKKQE